MRTWPAEEEEGAPSGDEPNENGGDPATPRVVDLEVSPTAIGGPNPNIIQLPPLSQPPLNPMLQKILHGFEGAQGAREAWPAEDGAPPKKKSAWHPMAAGFRKKDWKPAKATQTDELPDGDDGEMPQVPAAAPTPAAADEVDAPAKKGRGQSIVMEQEAAEQEAQEDAEQADAMALLDTLNEAKAASDDAANQADVAKKSATGVLAPLIACKAALRKRYANKLETWEENLECLWWALKWMQREYPSDFRKCMRIIIGCAFFSGASPILWDQLIGAVVPNFQRGAQICLIDLIVFSVGCRRRLSNPRPVAFHSYRASAVGSVCSCPERPSFAPLLVSTADRARGWPKCLRVGDVSTQLE